MAKSNAEIIQDFLNERVDTPTPGKWCSGFTSAKQYAEENEVPLISVWSNGEKCANCVSFIKCVMTTTFKNWMKDSGCIFWFGCSSDTSSDDKMGGTGYRWAWKNKMLNLYPFVRVWWKRDGVVKTDVAGDGNRWTCGWDDERGAEQFKSNIYNVCANFLDPECASGDCHPDHSEETLGPAWEGDDAEILPCTGSDCVPAYTDEDCKPDDSSQTKSELEEEIEMLN